MLMADTGASARLRTSIPVAEAEIARDATVLPFVAPASPVEGRLPARQGDLPPRIADWLAANPTSQPTLVVDLDVVEANYRTLTGALPEATVYYAVKANPADGVVARLAALGSCFDTASPAEIALILGHGVDAARISYGNTLKKVADIAWAYAQGVRLYAFDSDAELDKLAAHAPGARVYCRVLMECHGAEWPLSRKFGCTPEMALRLLMRARELGLEPVGVSFHVGSQQTDKTQWHVALQAVAGLFDDARRAGLELSLVNLGGGMPARYSADVHPVVDYAAVIMDAMRLHFGPSLPAMIVEPGRSIVGDAGVIEAEVVLISRKADDEVRRWVYLDIGKFSGLAETMDEAIKYRFVTPRDGGPTGPVAIAGPTCDSADILYEKTPYELPLDLAIGDKVRILSTGAYTTTYASVGFNGFAPLACVCI